MTSITATHETLIEKQKCCLSEYAAIMQMCKFLAFFVVHGYGTADNQIKFLHENA